MNQHWTRCLVRLHLDVVFSLGRSNSNECKTLGHGSEKCLRAVITHSDLQHLVFQKLSSLLARPLLSTSVLRRHPNCLATLALFHCVSGFVENKALQTALCRAGASAQSRWRLEHPVPPMDQHLKKTWTGGASWSRLSTGTTTSGRWAGLEKLRSQWFHRACPEACPTTDVCYHTDINGKQKYKNCNNNNNNNNMEYNWPSSECIVSMSVTNNKRSNNYRPNEKANSS